MDQPEGSLIGGPVLGVGAKALGKGPEPDVEERQVQRDSCREPGQDAPGAISPGDHGQEGEGRELREGGGRHSQPEADGAFRVPWRGPEQHEGQPEQSEGVEVGAPRRFYDQKGGPEIEHGHPSDWKPPAAGGLDEDRAGQEVEHGPHHLGRQDRTPGKAHEDEGELGERWVDRRNVGVVDQRMPGRSDAFQRLVARGVQVGVDARQLDVSVPQVPVDVVGELGGEGNERDPHEHGEGPYGCQVRLLTPRRGRGPRIADQRPRRKEQPGQRESQPTAPAEGHEESQLQETQGDQQPATLRVRATRRG